MEKAIFPGLSMALHREKPVEGLRKGASEPKDLRDNRRPVLEESEQQRRLRHKGKDLAHIRPPKPFSR